MKILRISDETHERLKKQAAREGRHLQVFAEQVIIDGLTVMYDTVQMTRSTPESNTFINIRKEVIETPSMATTAPSESFPPLGRLRSEIQAELDATRTYWTEALEYCQDQEETSRINKEYSVKVADLEAELDQVAF